MIRPGQRGLGLRHAYSPTEEDRDMDAHPDPSAPAKPAPDPLAVIRSRGYLRILLLAGLDIGYATRKRKYAEAGVPMVKVVADLLVEAGRMGQKTGAGCRSPGGRSPAAPREPWAGASPGRPAG